MSDNYSGVAAARIKLALDKIEAAQENLRQASELLCPVMGFVRQWEATGKTYGLIKKLWHQVDDHAQTVPFDLDESAKRAIAEGRTL